MCSNRKCPHHNRKSLNRNGCEIFVGVMCLQCREFRP